MPWIPDFSNAAELARIQTRAAGHADPVKQYFTALNHGDTEDLETVWPGEVVVYDPRAGEVRGHEELRQFVRQSRSVLAGHLAGTETVAATVVDGRAVVELLAHMHYDERDVLWPVAVVAEFPDERSVVFRSYFSRWVFDGLRHFRPSILEPAPEQPSGIVGRFQAALDAGDTEAVVSTFASNGYVRESIGEPFVHRGSSELRAYFSTCFSAGGGISLQDCGMTDDGLRCALEYNCVRWGHDEMPPQAGLAVFERSPDGLLAAARVYDDVDPPVKRS